MNNVEASASPQEEKVPWYVNSEIAQSIRAGFEQLAKETAGMTEEEKQAYYGDDFLGGGCH